MRKREIEVAKILIQITKEKLVVIKRLLNTRLDDTSLNFHFCLHLKKEGVETINDAMKFSENTILHEIFCSPINCRYLKKIINDIHPNFFLYDYGEGVDYLKLVEAILFTKKELFKLVKKINIENPNGKDIRNMRLLYLKLSIEKI